MGNIGGSRKHFPHYKRRNQAVPLQDTFKKKRTATLHPLVQLEMQRLFIYRQRGAAQKMRLDLRQHAITQRIHLDLAVNNLVKLGWQLQSDWNRPSLPKWCVGEKQQQRWGWRATPKPPEKVITLPVQVSASSARSPSPTVWKTKRMGFDSGNRLDLCTCTRPLRRVSCVRPHPAEIARWRHLLQGALVSGSHCLRSEMTGV